MQCKDCRPTYSWRVQNY